jgi:hypothetical protein
MSNAGKKDFIQTTFFNVKFRYIAFLVEIIIAGIEICLAFFVPN